MKINEMEGIYEKLHNYGYVVIPNLYTSEQIQEMKTAGEEMTEKLPEESQRKIFSTINLQQNKDQYFLDSAHKISYFFESDALDESGKLKVAPNISLNKVAHALHWLHPVFKKCTFDDRVKDIAMDLKFIDPAVCQSMYIYKNPGIGSKVTAHQDATYLYTDPISLVGFWIALDDATLENGCLWIASESHKSGVHRRYLLNRKDSTLDDLVVYDKAEPTYSLSNFRPITVKKGSCIILHGQVVHFSNENKSNQSRHAYTFHVIETKHTNYSQDNWLQPPKGGFPLLYKN